jgi:hypothetical protein
MISYQEIQVLSQLIQSLDISVAKINESVSLRSQKDFEMAKAQALDIQKKIKEEVEKIKKNGS